MKITNEMQLNSFSERNTHRNTMKALSKNENDWFQGALKSTDAMTEAERAEWLAADYKI